MEKEYIYLLQKRDNLTGHITSRAFKSEQSATDTYHEMLATRHGFSYATVIEETTVPVEHINLSIDEKMLMHYFIGPVDGNTAAFSYYVIRKELN